MNPEFWPGRSAFITGHTGFKGSWLSLWLHELGARVSGYALPPETEPNAFDVMGLAGLFDGTLADLGDAKLLAGCMRLAAPEIVFHLAAQPLVRRAYHDPVETFATNVMGTINVLEAVRSCPSVRAVVIVTSDKCYLDDGRRVARRESDALGGSEPYGASKACAEIVVQSYRASYFQNANAPLVASARAGNVIGGGDFSADRIIPDLVRSAVNKRGVVLRSPDAVRPWQHVIDASAGYLTLGEHLLRGRRSAARGWNFAPPTLEPWTVREITDAMILGLGADISVTVARASTDPHEADYLQIDASDARRELGFSTWLPVGDAVEMTAEWYRAWAVGTDMREASRAHLAAYQSRTATRSGVPA